MRLASLALLCCGDSDLQVLGEALEADAPLAASLCETITEPRIRTECVWDAATRMATSDLSSAVEACASLSGSDLDECVFLVAETARSFETCLGAGEMRSDCERHVFGRFGEGLPVDQPLAVAVMEARSSAPGFTPDATCWRDYMQAALIPRRPVTVSVCEGLELEVTRACAEAVAGIQARSLANAHERGAFPCAGPLPPTLATMEDDEGFLRLVAAAREAGRCSSEP
ncbi:MAG TPA: hypothetical protein QGF58_06455 [Myxococcota bacterium]|nr:hypothetical protein [Myxococcota bacterium]